MNVVLLRVGIDSGSGGMQGPLFLDGTFELIPIPDSFGLGLTYGEVIGTKARPLVDYFPVTRRPKMQTATMHLDPEFESFTYGDPTPPKRGLKNLKKGDLLVFYAGLEGWDHVSAPALYIVGYFVVDWAGAADPTSENQIEQCAENFHVRHKAIYEAQRHRLVLVRGGPDSRLLSRAHCVSTLGQDRTGKPLKVLSAEAQNIFGDFGGHISLQRSPPRWVDASYVQRARDFVMALP